MWPSEVLGLLRDAGREDDTLNTSTSTLGYLVKKGRLKKIEPHDYLVI